MQKKNVAGLPPFSKGVACVMGPWWWINDSILWIFVYLMMEFILKDPTLKNSVQGDIILKNAVQKGSTLYGDKH